jgi:ribosomal protein S18 acetylase RimI-like enzyme
MRSNHLVRPQKQYPIQMLEPATINPKAVELADDYTILLNGTPIGHIEPHGRDDEIIANIEIDEGMQGNGFGRKATELFLERAKKRGVGMVSTSVVISSAYEHILRDHLGFKETAPGEEGLYLAKEL